MKEDAVTFEQLCARLERAVHCPVGMRGLNILLYGWIAKYGRTSRVTLGRRHAEDGTFWLTPDEARHFSDYAGYDLTKD